MAFPNIKEFPESGRDPYERQMGAYLVELLLVFAGKVRDAESHARVSELAANPDYWSAGHAVFDEVRDRYLVASDPIRSGQYCFEESCCQAMYNATYPDDPFDASSAFFVVPQALGLASVLGIPLETLRAAFGKAYDRGW